MAIARIHRRVSKYRNIFLGLMSDSVMTMFLYLKKRLID